VNPIFGRLPNKSALVTSCRGIALDGMTPGSDQIIELGKLDDDSIVVVLVERAFLKVFLDESGL
jgi:hypothetical protein